MPLARRSEVSRRAVLADVASGLLGLNVRVDRTCDDLVGACEEDRGKQATAPDSQIGVWPPWRLLLSRELVHNRVVRTPEKALSFACLPLGGAVAGYVYLALVLRPVPPAVACPLGQLDNWRCASYQIIVSKPFFLLAGALIGTWFAYALVRLYTAPGRRSFTWREGLVAAPLLLAITAWIIALHPGVTWFWDDSLGWWEVVLFFLAAILVRLAIGIASVAKVRGSLIVAFGMPVIFAVLGYAFITFFQLPPVGHPCPAFAPASACVYHPLIGESGPWVFLGLLAGLWLAYAVAVGLAAPPRRGLYWVESAIALPAIMAVIWWALVVGPDQAGGGYVGRFVLAVYFTALLRILLGARIVRKEISGMLAKLGMVEGRRQYPSSDDSVPAATD